MDSTPSASHQASSKRPRRHLFNSQCCFLCDNTRTGTIVNAPSIAAVQTLIAYVNSLADFRDASFPVIKAKIGNSSAEDLIENGLRYHRECYGKTCHINELERAKKRHERNVTQGRHPSIIRAPGRPKTPLADALNPERKPLTRQSVTPTKDELCFFCQAKTSSDLRLLTNSDSVNKLKRAVEDHGSDELKLRLSGTMSNGSSLRYHTKCWLKHVTNQQRHMEKGKVCSEASLSEMQLMEEIENKLSTGDSLDMSNIEEMYENIRHANGISQSKSHVDRRTIKVKLEGHFGTNVEFKAFPKKPEQVLFRPFVNSDKQSGRHLSQIQESAAFLRKVLSQCNAWNFEGSLLSNDKHVPEELFFFLKCLLFGSNQIEVASTEADHRVIVSVADSILNAFRSDKRTTCKKAVSVYRSKKEWTGSGCGSSPNDEE